MWTIHKSPVRSAAARKNVIELSKRQWFSAAVSKQHEFAWVSASTLTIYNSGSNMGEICTSKKSVSKKRFVSSI